MFIGALPKETLEQMATVFPTADFAEIYICCSGSFRVEQVYTQVGAKARMVGNDVSLLSCAIGTLAASQRQSTLPFEFTERLAFLEDLLRGKPPEARVASLLIASEMGQYSKHNVFEKAHFFHYQTEAETYLAKAIVKLRKMLDGFRMDEFHMRDFRIHAKAGIELGAAIIAFPPTYRGGYEKLYAFMHNNIRWEAPPYDVFDPKDFDKWVEELDAAGVGYCVGSDKKLEKVAPVAMFTKNGRNCLYLYARTRRSAYARNTSRIKTFRYDPVTGDEDLKATSKVSICPADSGQMNFLKERYLAKGIIHTPGDANFLVFVDEKLAGGFIYARSKFKPMEEVYLLSDFSVTQMARVSKLIAMVATSYVPIAIVERRMVMRAKSICTTAFTKKPVSMKYRGAFKVASRGEGHIQYVSGVRQQTPQEIYDEWFRKHASAAPAPNKNRKGQAPRAPDPGE